MEVVVEYDYKADELDELSIKKGEIIKNVSQFEDGWYIGTLNGKTGVFPDNFVKILKPIVTASQDERTVCPDSSFPGNNDANKTHEVVSSNKSPSPAQSKKIIGIGLGNIFSGQQIQLKQLSVNESKARIAQENAGLRKEEEKKVQTKLTTDKEMAEERVRVKFPYSPKQPDEIALNVDDVIVILDKNLPDEGWWRGYNQTTRTTGLFPDNFVEALPPATVHGQAMRSTPVSLVNARSHPSLLVQSPSEKTLTSKTCKAKIYKNSDLFPNNEMNLEQHPITPISKANGTVNSSKFQTNREVSDNNLHYTSHQVGHLSPLTANRPRQMNKRLPSRILQQTTSDYQTENNGNEKILSNHSLDNFGSSGKLLHGINGQIDQILKDYQQLQLELRETRTQMQSLKKQSCHLEETNETLVLELNRTQKAFTERIQSLMAEIDEVKKSRAIDVIELKRVKNILMQIDAKYLAKGLDSQVGQINGGDDLHIVSGKDLKNGHAHTKTNGVFAGVKR